MSPLKEPLTETTSPYINYRVRLKCVYLVCSVCYPTDYLHSPRFLVRLVDKFFICLLGMYVRVCMYSTPTYYNSTCNL